MLPNAISNVCSSQNVYSFLFNPLSDEHSDSKKILALITVVALSILTCGIFLAIFLICRQLEDRQIEILPTEDADTIPYDGVQHGVSQYNYPLRAKRENIPQACTCHSAAAIFYLSQHLPELLTAVRSNEGQKVGEINRQIIDQGLAFWKAALKKGAPGGALHPEELKQFIHACEDLQFDRAEVVTETLGNFEEEVDRIFVKDQAFALGSRNYSMIQADGQSFLIFQINEEEAYLFDSHKTWSAIISSDQAKDYIRSHILHLEINPIQSIDFFHGTINTRL